MNHYLPDDPRNYEPADEPELGETLTELRPHEVEFRRQMEERHERTRVVVRSQNERKRVSCAARSTLAVIFGLLVTAAIVTAVFGRAGLAGYAGVSLCAAAVVARFLVT